MSAVPGPGNPAAARILALEEQAAHQARVIEDLSEEVRRQGALVDRLLLELTRQRERMGEIADAVEGPHEATRPPHY